MRVRYIKGLTIKGGLLKIFGLLPNSNQKINLNFEHQTSGIFYGTVCGSLKGLSKRLKTCSASSEVVDVFL